MLNKVDKKKFFVLLGMSLLSVVFVTPYIWSIQGELIRSTGISIPLLIITQFFQSLILFSITIFLGLYFSKKLGFKLPLIEALINKKDYKNILNNILRPSVATGIIVALTIFLADILFMELNTGISTHQNYAPVWQKLLASFYGGITEEILMRLFLMSFIVWIITRLSKSSKPNTLTIWIAIFLAAIIFGLGHLPITAAITEINFIVITRAIVLNGIGGVTFGYLFWQKGLESAMIAHFTTDIFLLTILPLIFI